MSSKGKAKTEQNADNEAPRYNIGGVAFRLISENELTGERWDDAHEILGIIDSLNFKISKHSWGEIVNLCACSLFCVDKTMSVSEIREVLTRGGLNISLATLIIMGFLKSNVGWLGLSDYVSQARQAGIREAEKITAKSETNGRPKN